jgi:hypothetical protein
MDNVNENIASLATGAELDEQTFADFVQRLRYHVQGEGVRDHVTADALFTVQARRIIFGIDRDYTDKIAVAIEDSMYFSPQEYWDNCDDDFRAHLDELANEDHDGPFLQLDSCDQWEILGALDDHTVSGWDEQWEHVNSHFTKEAAEAFIRRKKHDYRDGLRVYVDAQVYCWEFNAIIDGLLSGKIVLADQDRATPPSPSTASQVDERAAFEVWAKDRGLIQESHGIRSVNSVCDVALEAWKAGRAALASNPATTTEGAWVSVDDELPLEFDRVLVLKDCGEGSLESFSIGYIAEGHWWSDHATKPLYALGYRVTHWMLPPLTPEQEAARRFRAQGGNSNDSIPDRAAKPADSEARSSCHYSGCPHGADCVHADSKAKEGKED